MVRLNGNIKGSRVFVALCATAALLACATTPESDSAESAAAEEVDVEVSSQQLDRVEVESADGETLIVLEGLQDPAYTVERSEDTLVVELPGVSQPSASLFDALSDSETQVSVYDGLVDEVSASTFQGDEYPVTRIEVTFAAPAEFDIASGDDGLELMVRPGEPMAVADDSMDMDMEPGMDMDLADAPADDMAGAADPWAVAESIGMDETGDDDVEPTTDATDADESLASDDAGWGLGDEPAPAAIAEPISNEPASALEAVSVETAEAGVLLHLRANGMLSSASSFTLSEPDRLVVDLPGIESKVSQNKITVDSQWVKGVRIGAHPDKLRVVLDGGPNVEAFQGRRMLPSSDGLLLTVGAGDDLDAALAARVEAANDAVVLASVPTDTGTGAATDIAALAGEIDLAMAGDDAEDSPEDGMPEEATPEELMAEDDAWDAMAAAESSDTSPAAMASDPGADGTAEIFGLQYDRDDDRDRIAVLGDRVVDYEVVTPDSETVVVRIIDAKVSNTVGERITPDPGGPVSLVTTFQQPEVAGNEVRVVVRRAPGLEPRMTRRGSILFMDFENTGIAAAPPPAFIPGVPVRTAAQEEYANTLEVIEADGGSESLTLDDAAMDMAMDVPGDPMDAGSSLDDESYTGLPQFDEPASLADTAPLDDLGMDDGLPAASSASSVPADLDGPAAVDMLEEGGLIDGKEYVGRRISLDFKDVAIADVLRLIAEVSDLNVIAGDEVQGNITIRLVEVPWDQALDVILLTKGLGFVRVGNVLRIAPAEILKVEEEVRLQERRNKEKLEDLEVKLQPVNYASVDDVSDLVRRLLSPRGTVNTDQRTNTLIIKDISSVIDEATALIQAIDTQTPQVMIESKIVEANLEFGRELGSTWGFGTQPFVNPFQPGDLRSDLGSENFRFAGDNNVVVGNPITSVATGAINFGGFLLDDKLQVEVHIEAMERAGDGKVISSPRVVTLDNREAIIEQGVSIPFQTFEGGDAKLEFIDAVLSLKVTPHITTDKSIIMNVEVTRKRAGCVRRHADRFAGDREEPGQDGDAHQGRSDAGDRRHLHDRQDDPRVARPLPAPDPGTRGRLQVARALRRSQGAAHLRDAADRGQSGTGRELGG